MEIKLKAKYKNNVRAKHLLKLMKLANSLEQTKQIEAVKVFMLNLSSTNPVDLIPIPKDVDADIAESMFEVIRLRSHLFNESIKTGRKVLLADYFVDNVKKSLDKKKINDIGPTKRLITVEAFAKSIGAEESKNEKVISKYKCIRDVAMGILAEKLSRGEVVGDLHQAIEKTEKELIRKGLKSGNKTQSMILKKGSNG